MKSDTVRIWVWYIALAVSVLVILLSLKVGLSFLHSILRGILGYALIYGISEVSLLIFEKTGLPPAEEEPLGAFLDIAVGQDQDEEMLSTLENDSALGKPVAGQVSQELAQGLPDAEKQAEIIKRMGWGGD